MVKDKEARVTLKPERIKYWQSVGAKVSEKVTVLMGKYMKKFEEAAAAYGNYVNLLPNKDTSEKAAWSRAEIRFLRSLAQRVLFSSLGVSASHKDALMKSSVLAARHSQNPERKGGDKRQPSLASPCFQPNL